MKGSAKAAEVMMEADAVQFDGLVIEQEPAFRIGAQGAKADGHCFFLITETALERIAVR